MTFAVTPDTIRSAEAGLLAQEAGSDLLMQQAAAALAAVINKIAAKTDPPGVCTLPQQDDYVVSAASLLPHTTGSAHQLTIVIVAGPGGNGGDGLYAGAALTADPSFQNDVFALLWHPNSLAHDRAVAALSKAGGQIFTRAEYEQLFARINELPYILVDAIGGLGSKPFDTADAELWQQLAAGAQTVIAVDVPTGVNAANGVTAAENSYVSADYTITFGALRTCHAVAPESGTVLVAELFSPKGTPLSALAREIADTHAGRPDNYDINCVTALLEKRIANTTSFNQLDTLQPPQLEPASTSNKYRAGVTGIVAGSKTYPGAAQLCAGAAVNTAPGLLYYCGPAAKQVVNNYPEIVVSTELQKIANSHCWVFGPGCQEDTASKQILRELLLSETVLVIDAAGINLLAADKELQELLRVRKAATLLTPHTGEFARLIDSPVTDKLLQLSFAAQKFDCSILLKGRKTLLCDPQGKMVSVDAGHSWLATAGSGDVLSGILGALIAREVAAGSNNPLSIAPVAVAVHARAAWQAANRFGAPAPAPASEIVRYIPQGLLGSGVFRD